MKGEALKDFLEEKYLQYNRPGFIVDDPISIPHRFSKREDIEITAFWTAILAWGQRKTIINKCLTLFEWMDNSPHEFILHHSENDLKTFLSFKHRTFNDIDTLYFIAFFKDFYSKHQSLEQAFYIDSKAQNVEQALIRFHDSFFTLPFAPQRTRKHIATPASNSSCKRLNMFLRWMVRKDDKGVDFGIWNTISAAQLVCPCDVHVERVARKLGLITRKQSDWKTAIELTAQLKEMDKNDPVKYDFALFGLGVENIL